MALSVTPGLSLSAIYADEDLIQVRVSACNGAFGGTADVYVGVGELEQLAEELRGFPASISDTREALLGSFGADTAGGAVRMLFHCQDRAGHYFVNLTMESESGERDHRESACFTLATEPAAIDSFVSELSHLGRARQGKAQLPGIALTSTRRIAHNWFESAPVLEGINAKPLRNMEI